MSSATTARQLSKAIEQAARSTNFCVTGSLPGVDPGLEVDGLGAVRLPLKRTIAKVLVALCHPAPYGKGTETLVDTKVRNTFELDPKKFRLSGPWDDAIRRATQSVAEQLGLPADLLEARLYKLLVYERGGFFLAHRDSEKHDGMVASLIVVLPSPFEGGELIVRHAGVKQEVDFEESANGNVPCYAAFYADCQHEVKRVTRGVRICLAYNLVLNTPPAKSPSRRASPDDVLSAPIRAWVAKQPGTPLVFALGHHYTQRGLSLDLLKGADRELAELVVPAAEKADCVVHLAQVSRHLAQFADDGSFERSYRRGYVPTRGPLQIGETYADELHGSEWVDLEGKTQPWGEIPFEQSSIVSSTPLDEWKPTREEYEGYTGNAGNTLDRWYHRSALVLWRRDQHFDVIASAGVDACIPLFGSMTAKLARTPKKRLEETHLDCIRLARAIIAVWPTRHSWYGRDQQVGTSYEEFRDRLLQLHDRDTVARFLAKLAGDDTRLALAEFIVACCREFGWDALAAELKQLLTVNPHGHSQESLPLRDAEWLEAFCLDETEDVGKSALGGELCSLAVDRFCAPRPPHRDAWWRSGHREPSASERALPLLLRALLALGLDAEVSRVLQFIQGRPGEFTLDDSQVPALKKLVPWARKQLGSVAPPLASWLTSVRQHLESATAQRPTPPSDWARPAQVDCACEYCASLRIFLADPAKEVTRIPAREDIRRHLTDMIRHHQCDVTHKEERKGSPYSLVLTKTTGSYERAVRRYEADRRLLSELPPQP